jgi:hypothetical protein
LFESSEWRNESRIDISSTTGLVIIYDWGGGGGGALKRNVFLGKNFADPKVDIVLPNLKYQLKNKYLPLAKSFTKGYDIIQLSHMSFTASVT